VIRPEALLELQTTLYNSKISHSTNAASSGRDAFSGFGKTFGPLYSRFKRMFSTENIPVLPSSLVKETPIHGKCEESANSQRLHDYILLCIPFMHTAMKVNHAEVCQVQSDRLFFRLIRWYYNKHRGRMLSYLSLKKVRGLRFVQVSL
jgi:hypothetical protein